MIPKKLNEMLSFDDTTFGAQECEPNLAKLYPELKDRKDFEKRFESFVESDEFTRRLFYLSGDTLKYRTEVFASDRIDSRPHCFCCWVILPAIQLSLACVLPSKGTAKNTGSGKFFEKLAS